MLKLDGVEAKLFSGYRQASYLKCETEWKSFLRLPSKVPMSALPAPLMNSRPLQRQCRFGVRRNVNMRANTTRLRDELKFGQLFNDWAVEMSSFPD